MGILQRQGAHCTGLCEKGHYVKFLASLIPGNGKETVKKKYNIAFTPLGKADVFVRLAKSLSSLTDTYCLGTASLPHVTLRHFFAEESEIETLWQTACDRLTPHTL